MMMVETENISWELKAIESEYVPLSLQVTKLSKKEQRNHYKLHPKNNEKARLFAMDRNVSAMKVMVITKQTKSINNSIEGKSIEKGESFFGPNHNRECSM